MLLSGPAAWAADYRSQPPGVSGAALVRLIAGVAGNNKILAKSGKHVSRPPNGGGTPLSPAVESGNAAFNRRRRPELCLQGGDAGLERLVFLPCQPGHLLDGLKFLAVDHV